jgi:hypothetical protein
MKRTGLGLFTLCIIFTLILSACQPELVITLPAEEDTPTPEPAPPEEEPEPEPEASPEVVETVPGDLLEAGTVMKWYDEGYLVFVPKGEVTLGDNLYENNLEHSVFVDDYWIYMFPVTNGQYSQCVAAGACSLPASEEPYPDINELAIKDDPVIGVDWDQAGTYCQWMDGRLPSTAEWEKAARGPLAYTFPWGEADPSCDLLNYDECETQAVSLVYEYPDGRSYYQAFDLAGNTYEWVFDLYEDDFVSQLPGEEPYDPPHGTERSVRGSSYISDVESLPSAELYYLEPDQYRTDLGFRCVIGEGQPDGFASPCVQTAYIPGDPPPWLPGPQHGPMPLDIQTDTCTTDIGTSHAIYCSNQALQQGGLDLSIAALGSDEVYVKSWSSPQAVACIEGTDPLQCFGPELAPVTFEICATCTPPIQVENLQYTCDCGFVLSDTNPPTCIYDGSPPQPNQTCPAGFVYDLVNDICVKLVTQSQECQAGYEYDPNTQCCTATYAEPGQDPGTLPGFFLLCPPGYNNAPLTGQWVVQGQNYAICQYTVTSSQQEDCITVTYNLGECREEKAECKNPGSYTTEASCKAAHCKWDNPLGGPGGKCVMP